MKDVGRRLRSYWSPWGRVMALSNAFLAAAIAAVALYFLSNGRRPFSWR